MPLDGTRGFSAERLVMGVLLAAVAIGCAYVLRPFISAILWAAIFTYTTWPMFFWLRTRARLGQAGAAIAMVLLVAVFVVLPLALLVSAAGRDVGQLQALLQNALQAGLPTAPDWLRAIPILGPEVAGLWDSWAADLSQMGEFFRPYYGQAAELGLSLALGLANGVLEFLLALIITFFFYASGEYLSVTLATLLQRIAGDRSERLIAITGATMRGVVYGILGTAVVQGLLCSFGFWISGVPRPVLLATLAGALSVLPIGAPVVWIPASVWLMSTGHSAWGVLLFTYGLLFVSGSDNVIRPFFIARGAKLPFLLTMLGVLGGAIAFGLLGIFVGPVLLSVGFTLVAEWTRPVELERV